MGVNFVKAIWQGQIIAQSDHCVEVEGNQYFPIEDVVMDLLNASPTQSNCPWKGTASYYHINVNGQINKDAAWCYENPKEAALDIKGHLAFWKGVQISP